MLADVICRQACEDAVNVYQDDMLTATQIACEAELCEADAMCLDSQTESHMAAAVPGLPMQEQNWHEVIYQVQYAMTDLNKPQHAADHAVMSWRWRHT